MLYAIVFLVIFVIIILIWIVRLSVRQSRKAKMRHADPEIRANTIGDPVTFMGTARDVSDRVFGPPQPVYTSTGEEYMSPHRRSGAERGPTIAVNRTEQEGVDPDLPSYNDRTTIRVPQATYASPIVSRHETQRNGRTSPRPPSIGDAPPKYDEAPPIVRTI